MEMRLNEVFDNKANERDHKDALLRTGFWGAQAAGCIFVAEDTGRIMLAHRSEDVQEPHTWGGFGGAIDNGEDPSESVLREIVEETRYAGPVNLIPLYVFRSDTFRYYNFLAVVPNEFEPILDWENQGYAWVEWGDFPRPLHFGLVKLFSDSNSVEKILRYAGKHHEKEIENV